MKVKWKRCNIFDVCLDCSELLFQVALIMLISKWPADNLNLDLFRKEDLLVALSPLQFHQDRRASTGSARRDVI